MLRKILNLLKKDDLQSQALAECHEMLGMCEQMVAASVESLRHRDDGTIEVDIIKMDKKLNAFERDVRRKVMTHLALGNPGDLSSGLVLISIVIDLERIGDYSKNIYDLAVVHPERLHGGELEDQLAAIETETLAILSRATKAFRDGDVQEARQLMEAYKDDISARTRTLEHALVKGEAVTNAKTAVALALYMRFLKRISAHARNVASSVVNPFDRIGYPE
jgi:phosphate transport system protein